MSTVTPGRRRRRLGISTKAADNSPADATAEGTAATSSDADSAGAEPVGAPEPAELAPQAEPSEPQDKGDDLLSNFGGGLPAKAEVDLFAPQLVDRAQLPDAPEERLAVYEAAIEASRRALADTVTRAKFRAEIEIGFLLDAIRSEPDLYVPTFGTIENYGLTRWGLKRSTMYELMDTAPLRLAAASGKPVSGNPDTKGRKALGPPAQRKALEAGAANTQDVTPAPAPTPTRSLKVELLKSAALELVPVWKEDEETALAILADAVETAEASGRKLTAAVIRKTRLDWGTSEAPGELTVSEEEQRRAVNKALADAAAAAEKLVAALSKLGGEVPPFDCEAADKDVKAIRAAGRWLNTHAKVPAGIEIVEAEFVE
ncbi:hypothetical protein ACFVZH_37360 [Streptomyces sp. NPDC059534]|uniref:hypothetical protein n=1 Tax=Streptomyces sp. NPDC059534 TaxID=3346859 RepID=UPI00367D7036